MHIIIASEDRLCLFACLQRIPMHFSGRSDASESSRVDGCLPRAVPDYVSARNDRRKVEGTMKSINVSDIVSGG